MKAIDKLSQKYELIEKIGSGVEGQVLKAAHIFTREEVAVKYVKLSLKKEYSLLKVLREIEILRELSKGPGAKYITRLIEVICDPIPEDDME